MWGRLVMNDTYSPSSLIRCRGHTPSAVPTAHMPTTRATARASNAPRGLRDSASQSQFTPLHPSKVETLPVRDVEGFRWQIVSIHCTSLASPVMFPYRRQYSRPPPVIICDLGRFQIQANSPTTPRPASLVCTDATFASHVRPLAHP